MYGKADKAIIELLLQQKHLAPAFRKALTAISDGQQGEGSRMADFFVYTIEQACADNGIDFEQLRASRARWQPLVPDFRVEWLGIMPAFLDENDPRSAREQFAAKYCGGWSPSVRARITSDHVMQYPGDPDSPPLARTKFREETIVFYEYSFVAVIQPDGSAEVARMD